MAVVLDLKSAYDLLPRKKLYEVVQKTQREEVIRAVGFWLQEVAAHTQGDKSGTTAVIGRDVCQGSPLSQTLFNIYMNTLPERLAAATAIRPQSTEPGGQTWEITMFADDVKMQATNAKMMQHLLHTATSWAARHGMVWSTIKCKTLRTTAEMRDPKLELAGVKMDNSEQTEYLAVTATTLGTGDEATHNRISKTMRMAQALRREGIHYGSLDSNLLLRVWETHVLPKATYGLHLCSKTDRVVERWQALEKCMIITALGCFTEKNRA